MRRISYILSFIAVALFLLSVGSLAEANTIDPAIGVDGSGGTGSTTWLGSFGVFFDPNTLGVTCSNLVCDYNTPSGSPFVLPQGTIITSLTYAFDRSQNIGFSVTPGSVLPILTIIHDVDTTNPTATLTGGTILPPSLITVAITPSTLVGDFFFHVTGVVQGTNMTITSPEPGTVILLISGLGALGLRRLRRGKVV